MRDDEQQRGHELAMGRRIGTLDQLQAGGSDKIEELSDKQIRGCLRREERETAREVLEQRAGREGSWGRASGNC